MTNVITSKATHRIFSSPKTKAGHKYETELNSLPLGAKTKSNYQMVKLTR